MSINSNFYVNRTGNVFNDVTNDRHILARKTVAKQYYNLSPSSEYDWNKPYNKALRNALFDEPLQLISPPSLQSSYAGFHPDTMKSVIKKSASASSNSTRDIVKSKMTKIFDCCLPNDYYTSCISSNSLFTSCLDDKTLKMFCNQKEIEKYDCRNLDEGEISAVQVNSEGTNFIGTHWGSCYSIQGPNKIYQLPTSTDDNICSLALKDSLLYLSDKSGTINILSLKEGVLSCSMQFDYEDFICRIIPPFQNNHLLALGHNSNCVSIYDTRNMSCPLTQHTHNAAVRAMAWNPQNPNEIATGGGSNDREIHIWNANQETDEYYSLKTEAQVCNLFWNEWRNKQYLTCINGFGGHGYQIPIYLWKNKSLIHQTSLDINQEERPIHSALDGKNPNKLIVGGEGYIQFWNLFDVAKEDGGKSNIITP